MGVIDEDLSAFERVDDALAGGDWQGALDVLRDVQSWRTLTDDELDRLGHAAYGAGDLEATLAAWEELHGRQVVAGDHTAAASTAARISMYLMMDTGLMAAVRAWLGRAERLLEDHDETPVHAWLAMVRTYERFMSGDMALARRWADRAIEVGLRHDAPAPVALGRLARARLLIFDGHVDEGLNLLDEVAVTTVSGELEPLAVGMVYCELICAMQGLAQYDRAEEWTDAMERWRHGNAFGGIGGRCRVHRAEVLRLRGSCEDAELEALQACEELRPWMRREFGWPLTELGTIRLRKGDLDGAEEALLAAHERGWDPQPGLALLRLAQQEVEQAVALIADALDRPINAPSKERPPNVALRRAPLLEAQVEIVLAVGDRATARRAVEELGRIAEIFRSRALAAGAALARARVDLADGATKDAIREAQAAVAAWSDVGAPYETSVARMVLAEAHRCAGSEGRALLELRAAQSVLTRIGAEARAAEVEVALGVHPVQLTVRKGGRSGSSAKVFRRDGDVRWVVFDGEAVSLRDLQGMRYLECLLSTPGREHHVLDLVGMHAGVVGARSTDAADRLVTSAGGDAGTMLDARAKAAYQRRLGEIDEDIAEARRTGDAERAALAAADRDFIVTELTRAYGLGGRQRLANSDSERARASVTRALRYAIDRIAEHHPSLAEHLQHTVRTGTYCAYTPDPRIEVSWDV